MEIRVPCTCGQTYALEVEPVNGLMPCPVACPACGVDGTVSANEVIQQTSAPTKPASPSPMRVPMAPAAAPAPAPGLRINRSAPEATPPLPPPATVIPSAPVPIRSIQTPARAGAPAQNIPLGILGGVIGGGIGMMGWYFLTLATDHEFGIVAWLVGVIAGVGTRMLARDGSPVVGYIAAVSAALAILGAEFLVANAVLNRVIGGMGESAYSEQMSRARDGVKLKTDDEIKNWLAKDEDSTGQPTAAEIEKFRNVTQPKLQEFLNGKPSKAEFVSKITDAVGSFGIKFRMFKETMSLFTILWLVFGISSAWRIGSK